jgi:hypothetical protein
MVGFSLDRDLAAVQGFGSLGISKVGSGLSGLWISWGFLRMDLAFSGSDFQSSCAVRLGLYGFSVELKDDQSES